jgi:hypothetical protein
MKRKLTDEDKVFIITNREKMTWGRMHQVSGIPKSTMRSFYKKWITTKKIANLKPGKSPPFALTKSKQKQIETFLKANPRTNQNELINRLRLTCSIKTLRRTLHKLGYRKYTMRKKPKLTQHHRNMRLRFARHYRNWTLSQWNKVLWSDESSVELYKNYQEKVWRKPGLAYEPKYCLNVKTVYTKQYLKVWSCFSSRGTGKIVFKDDFGRWNSHNYKKILEENLIQEGRRLVGSDFIFQQDNDKVHTSGIVQKWLKIKRIKTLDGWPPGSSEISPIENLWFLMKRELAKRPFVSLDNFKRNIIDIWSKIDRKICKNLVSSMPRRLKMVIDRSGDATKY